jgi:hypothetical protein
VQGVFAISDTDAGATVAEAMDKRQEIPAKPNAAARAEVDHRAVRLAPLDARKAAEALQRVAGSLVVSESVATDT